MTTIDFKEQLADEGRDILGFWMKHVIDMKEDRIYGHINNDNSKDPEANLSGVLIARMVWTFSRAFSETRIAKYGRYAQFCYEFLMDYFWDAKHGGIFWEVSPHGDVIDSRKLTYVQAFGLYGFCEYYRAMGDENVLEMAEDLFIRIEKFNWDEVGYIEGVARDWTPIGQVALSEKEVGAVRTMNTHLHVMEAYATYLDVIGSLELKCKNDVETALERSIYLMIDKIYDEKSGHLNLFFHDDWGVTKREYSPGHDIEAAWLLLEAVDILKMKCSRNPIGLKPRVETVALRLIDQTLESGQRENGSLIPEYLAEQEFTDFKEKNLFSEWWTMAEAWIGFLDAYLMTKEDKYYDAAVKSFTYIRDNLKDEAEGEWFFGLTSKGELDSRGKVGFWKCPYHSYRGCLEGMKRINKI